jgi:hypothetical protein
MKAALHQGCFRFCMKSMQQHLHTIVIKAAIEVCL